MKRSEGWSRATRMPERSTRNRNIVAEKKKKDGETKKQSQLSELNFMITLMNITKITTTMAKTVTTRGLNFSLFLVNGCPC